MTKTKLWILGFLTGGFIHYVLGFWPLILLCPVLLAIEVQEFRAMRAAKRRATQEEIKAVGKDG